jgi:hypothetical protein
VVILNKNEQDHEEFRAMKKKKKKGGLEGLWLGYQGRDGDMSCKLVKSDNKVSN